MIVQNENLVGGTWTTNSLNKNYFLFLLEVFKYFYFLNLLFLGGKKRKKKKKLDFVHNFSLSLVYFLGTNNVLEIQGPVS